MLALHNRFVLATVLLFVLLFIFLDKFQKVERALSNENNFAIFDASHIVFGLDNATLSNPHRLKEIVAANVNLSLAFSLKSDYGVVIKARREHHVVSVTSVGQVGETIERFTPLFGLKLILWVIKLALSFR